MTDYKRPASELALEDIHDDLKKHNHTKPGRKPIDTEPKSKRTAQNRAAQRAYRERKEKRMKDLEDKVKNLEDRNLKANTETDYLKAQVSVLKQELARYRGTSDFSDLNLPTTVGHLLNPNKQADLSIAYSDSLSSLSNYGASVSANTTPESYNNFLANFPWGKNTFTKNNNNTNVNNGNALSNVGISKNSDSLPDLVQAGTSSSTLTSPANDLLVSPESSDNSSYNANSVMLQQPFEHLDFGIKFEESVDPFCALLNEACGTKDCPVPKYKGAPTTSTNSGSPFAQLSDFKNTQRGSLGSVGSSNYSYLGGANDLLSELGNANHNSNNSSISNQASIPNYQAEDPLSFLADDAFDVSLALGGSYGVLKEKNEDPLASLITEDSLYDPLADITQLQSIDTKQQQDINLSAYIEKPSNDVDNSKKDVTSLFAAEDDAEVVPAPEQTVRCSEIWDRITSHPKYTEIDIDLLCSELKQKAKCSEKGVVINDSDVNQLLEKLIKRGI